MKATLDKLLALATETEVVEFKEAKTQSRSSNPRHSSRGFR